MLTEILLLLGVRLSVGGVRAQTSGNVFLGQGPPAGSLYLGQPLGAGAPATVPSLAQPAQAPVSGGPAFALGPTAPSNAPLVGNVPPLRGPCHCTMVMDHVLLWPEVGNPFAPASLLTFARRRRYKMPRRCVSSIRPSHEPRTRRRPAALRLSPTRAPKL